MPASPSTARAINDRLALRLLQQEGPLTAGQLKQLTGLSRPTVADLVERLTASGLIEVVGETGEQRRGPNAKLYGIVADRAHLAALDVRTEGVAVVVSDLLGRVLAEASVPIDGDMGTGPAVEQAVALVERVAKEAGADRLHTVGIGAPGLIDPASGELRDSSGLPEWHRRLVAALQERLPEARVSVENETNLAALAEQRDGAARDRETFVLLWLGHGTGAAVVLDGTLRRGASGGTGEIGFLPVPGTGALPSATDCEGGFHSLTGSAAIAELAEEYGISAPAAQEPPAAGLVRQAVAAVTAAGTEADLAGPVPALGDLVVPVVPGSDLVASAPSTDDSPASAPSADDSPASAPSADDSAASVASDADPAASVASDADSAASVPSAADSAAFVASAADSVASALSGADLVAPVASAADSAAFVASDADSSVASAPSAADSAGPALSAADPATPTTTPTTTPTPSRPARPARFLDVLADRIAVGVASVVAILDPGCVVLGGEVGQAGGEELAARVAERIRRMSPLPTEVRPSALGGGAVLRGALLTARDRAQDDLFAPPERQPQGVATSRPSTP